jgi:EAL domain-containing protein (putative c-di-GMP-specific phosphodiesterase class I)
VHAVIGLGERMGIAVIAEGVETREQADALRAVGCREAQGFLFGNPTDAIELPFVRQVESNARRSWADTAHVPSGGTPGRSDLDGHTG